jgi:hypothetical protein
MLIRIHHFRPSKARTFGHPLRLPSRVPFVAGEVKMKIRIANAAGAILLASAMAASAQTGSSTPNTGRSATAPNSATASTGQDQTGAAANEPLRQQVRDNLAKAGFTDIRIMPTSFMVRAKDQSGNPVMMVINPDSFTEVTAIPGTSSSPGSAPNNNNAGTQKH